MGEGMGGFRMNPRVSFTLQGRPEAFSEIVAWLRRGAIESARQQAVAYTADAAELYALMYAAMGRGDHAAARVRADDAMVRVAAAAMSEPLVSLWATGLWRSVGDDDGDDRGRLHVAGHR